MAEPLNMPEESLEDLYEDAPCGYLCTGLDGTIVRINRTLLRWLGYERGELVGNRRFIDLLTTAGKVFHETHYMPLLLLHGMANEIALDVVAMDGRNIPALLSSKLLRAPDGEATFIRTSIFNATERRRYERELLLERRKAEQATKLKADFLSTLSHEVRNQVHAISAVTELLSTKLKAEDHERYLKMLDGSAASLLGLVNDILDYSKLEAGKLTLDERPFRLSELVQSVASALQGRAELRGLTLHTHLDANIPPLLVGDLIKISQVLTNLGTNALKFTDHGSISFSVRLQEQGPTHVRLRFVVSDTGIGIPQAHLGALMDEFTGATREVSARTRGTGLGLSICRRLLALHGSQLQVDSREGAGSAFSFELTLAIADLPEARSMMGDLLARRTLAGVRLLVALPKDADSDDQGSKLTHLLQDWGAEYDLVDSGERVLECVTHEPYDLVLMDVQVGGERTTRVIRELPRSDPATLPILALGASGDPGQLERLAGAGVTDFVGQPFESDGLFRSIARHASIHRALCARELQRRGGQRAS